jgi:hypothetical protein
MDSAAQLKRLSVIKGNLPLLETLNIDVQGCVPESTAADLTRVFEVTPRLTKLRYCGPHAALSELPLEQLELFVYVDVLPQHLDSLISVMARLSNGSNCQIRVNMDDDNFAVAIDPPATSSNVSILSLCAAGAFDSDVARELLSGFVARLTLPFLDGLRIICHQDQDVPLPWPHLDFLALSNRSSFYDHLTVLSLESVFITEAELLQTLSDLPSLQGIVISDHRVVDGQSEELVLVTNSLLQRLTWTSDPACLVPDLAFLECHSLLKFDDTVCRDFVLSRLKPRPKSEGPFDVKLHWYPKYYRRLDPVVVAQFRELQTQGELLFSISASSLFPSTHSD